MPGSWPPHPTSLRESGQAEDYEECSKGLSTLERDAKCTLRPIISSVRVIVVVDDDDDDNDHDSDVST